MWTLRGWSSLQAAWLLALVATFAPRVQPSEVDIGIASALLTVAGLWALDHLLKSRYPAVAFSLVATVACLWVFFVSYFGACLDWCGPPWLGVLGLPTMAALAWSSAVGIVTRRTWAWTGLVLSPIPVFFLSAMTLPSTGLLAIAAMAVVWTAIGMTARECLSWRRPAEA